MLEGLLPIYLAEWGSTARISQDDTYWRVLIRYHYLICEDGLYIQS